MQKPVLFGLAIAASGAVALTGAGFALVALASGPIGFELQNSFMDSALSRLSVLQLGGGGALIAVIAGCLLIANGSHRNVMLKSVCSGSWAVRIWRMLDVGQLWRYWVLVGAAGLWVNIALLWQLPVIACLEPDTIGYLQPSALRSSGYMLFLDAIETLGGNLNWIVAVQLNMMLVAFAVLGRVAGMALKSPTAGLVITLVPMLSAGLLLLSPAVMSEALFVALICVHLACVIHALRTERLWAFLGAGVALGLLILVRPNGISFLVGLLILAVMLRAQWKQALGWVLAPVVVLIVAQGLYHQQTFGFWGLHKFGGVSMVGVMAPLIKPDMPSEHPKLVRHIAKSLESYYVDFPPFEERNYPFEMTHVASLTGVGAIYYQILPAIREYLRLPEPRAVALEYDPRINTIAGSLALSAAKYDPWGALKIVTSNYIGNWRLTLPIRVPMATYYPRCQQMNEDFISKYPDIVSSRLNLDSLSSPEMIARINLVGASGIRAIEWPRMILGVFQMPLGFLTLVISLIGVALGFWPQIWSTPDAGIRTFVYASWALQAGYALISIGNAAFARYTVVFDPLVVLVLLSAAVIVFRYLNGWKRVS